MPKPRFVFEAFKNSFSVYVENLEKLSVEQIKQIEGFVSLRGGIFDFETYIFTVQKRLDFDEFVHLVSQTKLDASIYKKTNLKLDAPRVGFGKYKGVFYKDIPDSYLLWLESNYYGKDRMKIEDELRRREDMKK